ncbi:MAG: type II toxin-antitoxin system Phd/YefM family antitoxin [Moorellaceae bacterium]
MALQVNIHEAKTHFSKILTWVKEGEEVIIAKAGVPVARLVPVTQKQGIRIAGSAKGKIMVAPDFDAALPEDILEAFEQ